MMAWMLILVIMFPYGMDRFQERDIRRINREERKIERKEYKIGRETKKKCIQATQGQH